MNISSILISGFLVITFFSQREISAYSQTDSCSLATDTITTSRKIIITGVGDIMLGTSYPSGKYLPPGNNPFALIEDLTDTLSSSDITFGNLEGSFLNNGEPAKKCRDTTKCYLFRMPESYSTVLQKAGFDILSLANNHVGDFGEPAKKRTLELLDSLGIFCAGLVESPWSVFEKEGIIYGFCAFAPNAGTVSLTDIPGAEKIVRFLADTADIVIVSFHGGAEGADYQRVPKAMETYAGENRGDVYEFAHRMIDAGADVVFGHGPHVTRAIEVYSGRFISYSLGNFCTYGRFNLSGPNGIAPVIKIAVDSDGAFLSGSIIPVYQRWEGGVKIDRDARVVSLLRELVALDFPDSLITISEGGQITFK